MGARPALPPEGAYSEVERDFIDNSPPGLWPTNQDSYFGQLRKVICDQIQAFVDLTNELFLDTFATTTNGQIELWEEQYGLPVNPDLSVEDRRALIIPRRRYGPFTRARRNAIIEKFILATFGDAPRLTPSGIPLDAGGVPLFGDVHDLTGTYNVVEDIEDFSFDIRIHDTITINEMGLTREMNRVMPAHLSFTISYVPDVFA